MMKKTRATDFRPYFRSIFLPPILVAMVVAVIRSSPRHLTADKFTLLAVLALTCVMYIKTNWLVGVCLIYSTLILITDINVFDDTVIHNTICRASEFRIPIGPNFNNRDFMDQLQFRSNMAEIKKEESFLGFLVSSLIIFLACLTADKILRSRILMSTKLFRPIFRSLKTGEHQNTSH